MRNSTLAIRRRSPGRCRCPTQTCAMSHWDSEVNPVAPSSPTAVVSSVAAYQVTPPSSGLIRQDVDGSDAASVNVLTIATSPLCTTTGVTTHATGAVLFTVKAAVSDARRPHRRRHRVGRRDAELHVGIVDVLPGRCRCPTQTCDVPPGPGGQPRCACCPLRPLCLPSPRTRSPRRPGCTPPGCCTSPTPQSQRVADCHVPTLNADGRGH